MKHIIIALVCLVSILALFNPLYIFAQESDQVTLQSKLIQEYARDQQEKGRRLITMKQPDAQIIELGQKYAFEVFGNPHCMQAALMSNDLIVPVPCDHHPGEW